MCNASIVSVNVGTPSPIVYGRKEVMTGIVKRPAAGRLHLSKLNFEGDKQADLIHHGGEDKAVCVYAREHYAFWEQELGRKLELGAFGENVTTEGLLEKDICIGDIYELGEAVVQVSQPRQPCFKLAARYGVPELPVLVQNTGYTGYYFRVLQEGRAGAGDRLLLRERHAAGVSLAEANEVMHHDKTNREAMMRMLAVEPLSASWRDTFEKRLGGESTETKERLTGNK
jgi:Uncharacterized protein conserved in bacteria